MTEWAVFGVVVALVGFVATVSAPMLKLNTAIVKLTVLLDNLARQLAELTESNSKTHERIWKRIDELEARVNEQARQLQRVKDREEIYHRDDGK